MSDAGVHPNHRVQRDYPSKVRFCPLCGADMADKIVMPDQSRRKVCSSCGFVLFPGPKLVAGCLVVNANKVLLIKRGIEPALGKWTFPGGYVDSDESAPQGAVRETREEVGMNVVLGDLLGVFTDAHNPALTLVVYLAAPGVEAPGLSDEATEARYFSIDEIPWPDLAFPTTIDAVTAWASRRRPLVRSS